MKNLTAPIYAETAKVHFKAAAPAPAQQVSGVWECEIASETLRWSSGVFKIFGLSPEAGLERGATAAMYCDESRLNMEMFRAHAIARRKGFTLDAEIFRADGARRWIRIAANVVCRDGRVTHIYGTKRDITDER